MTHFCGLSGIAERLQTEVTILKRELNEMRAVHGKRKERASGKRLILKGKTICSTEELHNALAEAEKATRSKKRVKKRKCKRQVQDIDSSSSEGESEASEGAKGPNSQVDSEILDCIEVAL